MEPTAVFFSGLRLSDIWFLSEAALRTLLISGISISLGTFLGLVFGWMLHESRIAGTLTLAPILDAFRSVPLIIQLVLFYNFAPIIGLSLDPFACGTVILTIYTAALVANVARGAIDAVGLPLRRASRSLGMSYWQDMFHIVAPVGIRAVFPAWVGVALGVMKDSALARINHQFGNWAPYYLEFSLQYCLWPIQSMIRHFSAQLKHKVSNLVVIEQLLALVRHYRADCDALATPGASTKTGHWMF